MHVQPRRLGNATADEVSRELQAELLHAGLRAGHLPPEQMAWFAVGEIEHGHDADAALWLALASYRYHEELVHAVERGYGDGRHLPANVRRSVYFELVKAEIKYYLRLNFDDELDTLAARVYGRTEQEKALEAQMTALGRTSPMEREALRDALWQLRPSAAATAPPRYPALVNAFRRRLRDDFASNGKDEHPGYYLGRTPIPTLQGDAVQAAVGFFEPYVCVGVAGAFPLARSAVVESLASPRPRARANAAAILAMAPSEETRAALEARLAAEQDPGVKLALAFALVHHGKPEHAAEIEAALASCQGADCTLPTMLVQWLPPERKAEVDPAMVARIAAGKEYEPRAHLFASAILRDLGRKQPLDLPRVVSLIMAAGRADGRGEDGRVVPALQALAEAEALSRTDVIRRLDPEGTSAAHVDFTYPAPLLARLTTVATADDLPLLGRMMGRFGDKEGVEAELVVEATLHVPGEQADARLINWFNRYDHQRLHIGVGLTSRPTVPPATLARLIARADARTQMVMKSVTHAPDTQATMRHYLREGTLEQKVAAAEVAGVIGGSDLRPDLVPLLYFDDARYYPADGVVRYEGMAALVRIAIRGSKPSAPATSAPLSAAPAP